MTTDAPERTLTELDHVRLDRLLQRHPLAKAAVSPATPVARLLDEAMIVPSRQVSPDVVTMYSQVLLRDLASDQRSIVTPTYPADAEPATGFVSVLSPVGAGILGLPVGAVARWTTPMGAQKSAEIVALLFQPESSGDFTT